MRAGGTLLETHSGESRRRGRDTRSGRARQDRRIEPKPQGAVDAPRRLAAWAVADEAMDTSELLRGVPFN